MKKCVICGREHKIRVSFHNLSGMILCEKHKQQFIRHGTFMEQSREDKNKIVIHESLGYASLFTNNRKGEIIAECFIDVEDIDKVKDYKWFMRKDKRIVSNITKDKNSKISHIRIHNLIMGIDANYEYEVDHIDCNPLNNRKSNLRISTKSTNGMNRGLQSNNSTGVTGEIS